jgi:hypothetical protein
MEFNPRCVREKGLGISSWFDETNYLITRVQRLRSQDGAILARDPRDKYSHARILPNSP